MKPSPAHCHHPIQPLPWLSFVKEGDILSQAQKTCKHTVISFQHTFPQHLLWAEHERDPVEEVWPGEVLQESPCKGDMTL